MNVVQRCKVYSLNQFTQPFQYTCEFNGKPCSRIHVVQETLSDNDKTRVIVEKVRTHCSGNGLILNISSLPWELERTYHQSNPSMLEFDSFVQFVSQLCSDPVTAFSRCQTDSEQTTTKSPLAWILIDNMSHLAMDPKFNAKVLSKLMKTVQQTFGSVIISTSLPLSFHGGIESTFKHHSTKYQSGDQLVPYFDDSDVIL